MNPKDIKALVVAASMAMTVAGGGSVDLVSEGTPARDDVRPCRVMAIGDSITADGETSWRALVDAAVEWVGPYNTGGTRHAARRGHTSAQMLTLVPGWIEEARPDIGVVLLGSNDVVWGIDPADTAANVQAIVDMLVEHGANQVVVGTVSPRYERPDDLGAVDATNEALVAVAGAEVRRVAMTVDMTTDGVHPNDAGRAYLADVLALPELECRTVEPSEG